MAIASVGSEWGRVVSGALSFFTKSTGTETFRLGAGTVGYGVPENCTVASGVLTVTKPFVIALPESSTTDTVDSITYTNANVGDRLMVIVPATNTITFDNSATMLLGASTRVVAPGGCIEFVYYGTTWIETNFLTAAS